MILFFYLWDRVQLMLFLFRPSENVFRMMYISTAMNVLATVAFIAIVPISIWRSARHYAGSRSWVVLAKVGVVVFAVILSLSSAARLSVIGILAYSKFDLRTSNIEPGEADYPVKNPNAEHTFRLSGTADPRLHFQMFLTWMPSNRSCRYATSILEGADSLYRVDEAVDPVRHGSEYEIVIQTDHMIRGRCDWHLVQIFARGNVAGMVVIDFITPEEATVISDQSLDSTVNFYCADLAKTGRADVSIVRFVCSTKAGSRQGVAYVLSGGTSAHVNFEIDPGVWDLSHK